MECARACLSTAYVALSNHAAARPHRAAAQACRYDPCIASADKGDHSWSIHGEMSSDEAFGKEWGAASVQAGGDSSRLARRFDVRSI